MAKKKRTTPGKSQLPSVPAHLGRSLAQAERLLEQGQALEARETLQELDRRFPNQPAVLQLLINASYDLKDFVGYERAAERLHKLRPNDPDLTLMLAGAYMVNIRPVHALRAFHSVVERWPEHPRAGEAQKTIAELGERLAPELEHLGLAGAEAEEIAWQHEEVLVLNSRHAYAEARAAAERLLSLRPDFVPALNNASLASFSLSDLEQAIGYARRALEVDAHNFHALGNLSRYLLLSGRTEEAAEYAQRLKALEIPLKDAFLKQAEALSFLGDDQGVLVVFERAKRAGDAILSDGLLHHFAAVATLRQADENRARRHWQEALELAPGLGVARANLEDLRKPVWERHAPWAFTFGDWTSQAALAELTTPMKSASKPAKKGDTNVELSRLLQRRPDLAALVPPLLDRGDPQGRQFAVTLAKTARTPELLEALRNFALGQRGPDSLRLEAAYALEDAGVLPTGETRLWIKGRWENLLLKSFTISGEAQRHHRPQVLKLVERATILLNQNKAAEAEPLLRQAIELAPDAPDIRNNLAVAIGSQGREAEAEAMVREIHERFPDYFFARTSVAQMQIRDRDYAAARETLMPLLQRKSYHTSEFTALCNAQLMLLTAEKQTEAARQWLKLWEDIDPQNPLLANWKRRLEPLNIKHLLSNWLDRR
jgi:tetratricopeptide (TPR) repeat protein